MTFLHRVSGLILLDRPRSSVICDDLAVTSHIEKSKVADTVHTFRVSTESE